jgi:glycosyltransferase involved in cell wall biosynthesis
MRLFRAIGALLDAGCEVHYLAVVPFPIEHPRCYFHRFPWPAGKTEGVFFWTIFHAFAPIILLYLGIRHRITRSFAFGTSYGLILQPLRLLKGITLTLFLRADMMEGHHFKGRGPCILRLEKIVEGLALAGSRFYGVSRHLTQAVLARHSRLRPSVSGTLPNDVPEVVAPERSAPEFPWRIGCVGTLDVIKNHALAIRCLRHFTASQVRLTVYGTGPEEQALKNLAKKLDVEDRISFPGWVDTPSLIWPGIDLLLFPSRREGSPNAVLDALAWGVPVLASDIPEHREILEPTSLLLDDDENAWTERLGTIVTTAPASLQSLRELQQQCARKLKFDWNAEVIRKILD